MNYELEYADRAVEELAALPLEIQGAVEANLLRLAASPVTLSRRLVFPYAPPGQLFHFNVTTVDGVVRHFTIFFLYVADEQTLHIARVITHLPPGPDDPA